MNNLVSYQLADGVATLTLQNGKVNAFSHQLIDELNAGLDQAEQQQAVVVITGQPGMFSGGYDLAVMQKSPQDAMQLVEKGSQLARRMLAFPLPIIAACTGHAIAKGAFTLLSADYRIGVEGPFKIGLNEVQIGMTMHHFGIELARGRLAEPYFSRSVINAEIYSATDAVAAGFLDVVVPEAAFASTVQAAAKAMQGLNAKAHRQTKVKARQQWLTALDAAIKADSKGGL